MSKSGAAVLREAWKSLGATRWFSAVTAGLTFVLGALMIALVGQAHHQNTLVAEGFMAPDRRTITVTAVEDATALSWADCVTLRSLGELEACWSSGRAFEVHNPRLPFGSVSARQVSTIWPDLPIALVAGRLPENAGEAIIDEPSARILGLDSTGGVVRSGEQREWTVVGTYRGTQAKSPHGVVTRAELDTLSSVHSVSVVTRSLAGVAPSSGRILEVLAPAKPESLRVGRAEELSTLSGGLAAGILKGGLTVVFSVFAVSWIVTAMLCLLMVRSRAVEFGRRRALGASRDWLLALVLTQGLLTTAPAAVLGAGAGIGWNYLVQQVTTPWSLVAWLVAWQSLGALTAQLPPALSACLRDPVRVLRAP